MISDTDSEVDASLSDSESDDTLLLKLHTINYYTGKDQVTKLQKINSGVWFVYRKFI